MSWKGEGKGAFLLLHTHTHTSSLALPVVFCLVLPRHFCGLFSFSSSSESTFFFSSLLAASDSIAVCLRQSSLYVWILICTKNVV
jgi:hypothetical protein